MEGVSKEAMAVVELAECIKELVRILKSTGIDEIVQFERRWKRTTKEHSHWTCTTQTPVSY